MFPLWNPASRQSADSLVLLIHVSCCVTTSTDPLSSSSEEEESRCLDIQHQVLVIYPEDGLAFILSDYPLRHDAIQETRTICPRVLSLGTGTDACVIEFAKLHLDAEVVSRRRPGSSPSKSCSTCPNPAVALQQACSNLANL